MIFHVYKPASPLDAFVENLIFFDGLAAPHSLERFLPDGNTELIIDLRERPQHIYHNETLQQIQVCRDAWVSGVRTQPITIPSGSGSRMLVVAFKKGKAYPFYRFPMNEITDIVADADVVFGRNFRDFRAGLLAETSPERMFRRVERFLLQQAGETMDQDAAARCIEYAVARLVSGPTPRRLDQLSHEIGYSQKHFIALFRQQVGVTPKQYLRIMRFQRAIRALKTQDPRNGSLVAQESGFYDQAHFIHDFKLFSGFTPAEYVKRKSMTLNYIPVQ